VWEVYLLAFLIALGFGVAILMARKTKAPQITVIQSETKNNNLEELAIKIAKAVANEVLQKVSAAQLSKENNDIAIEMDIDKIIPIAIDNAIKETNLDKALKEEETIDKGLEKSKSKLANIFKKRKE